MIVNYWPAGVIVASEHRLEALVEDLYDDPLVAPSIQDLTVQLRSPFSPQTLRLCLGAANFITDLILFLPPDITPNLLDGIRLPRLQLFKTNRPHCQLLHFLSLHSSLTDLCLDACQRGEEEVCPLRPIYLPATTTVECPIDCFTSIANPKLIRLTGQSYRHSPDTPTVLLRSLKRPLVLLMALTLDIFPNDYDILRNIISFTPKVEQLKLLERPRAQRRKTHARRAWNDATAWSSLLARLDLLQDFALRTSSSLVRSPTLVSEGKVVVRWATRVTRVASITRGHEHLTLTSLRIWYRSSEPGGGILTCWSKSTGVWGNVARLLDPASDTPF